MCFLKLNMYFYFVVLIELNVQCSSLVGKFDNLFEYILKIFKYELKNNKNSNIMYLYFYVDFVNNRLFILLFVNLNKCFDIDEQYYDFGVFLQI